jgi:hypothetical protein
LAKLRIALLSKDVSQNMTDHVAIGLENEKPKPTDHERVVEDEKL